MANATAPREFSAGAIRINGRAQFGQSNSTLIPLAILHHQVISPGAKLVYSKLLNYASAGAPASTKRLAADLGISPRGVRNHVAELRHARLLQVETNPGKANLYTVSTVL